MHLSTIIIQVRNALSTHNHNKDAAADQVLLACIAEGWGLVHENIKLLTHTHRHTRTLYSLQANY